MTAITQQDCDPALTRCQPLRISAFIMREADGSGISHPDWENTGYQMALREELARLPRQGGWISIDIRGFYQLADWCDAMSYACGDEGNTSGQRSMLALMKKCDQMSEALRGAGYRSEDLGDERAAR